MTVNFGNIPSELQGWPQWVLWRCEERPDSATGELKWTKPPYQPNGISAESDNPNTWVSFAEAKASYERGGFSGIGYVVTVDAEATADRSAMVGDGITGIDLDHVVASKTGTIEPWAQSIVDRLNSYTEISPSGTGLRIFVYAKLPPKDRKIANFECYESGRYLTITGNHLPGTPLTIEHRHEKMTAVHTEMFSERNKTRPTKVNVPSGPPTDLADDALLQVAFAAKNGDAVSELYYGGLGKHSSASEADLALCNHLAFYTGGDAARIDRMFRASDRMRYKWDSPRGNETWGAQTIAMAIESQTEVHTGHSNGHTNGHQPDQAHSVHSGDSVQGVWENPQPFASVEVPDFPINALPIDLADYVSQEAEAKQVPIDLPGCLALGATAAAVAGNFKVFLNDDWSEPINTNIVVVLPSGERKSPAFKEVFGPMEEREQELVAAKTPEILRAQTERDILDKRLQNTKTEAAKADANSRLSAEAEARELATELAETEIPVTPRLLADDATPEAVAGLLADQKGRLAIISTEGGIFDIIAGRYSESAPNLDVYLKGYSGDTIRVDRRGRPPEFIPNPCLTVVLTVQPDVIRDLAGKRGFRGRGFLARWNYSLPVSKVGFRNNNAPTVRPEAREQWKRIQFAILELPYPDNIGTPLARLSLGAHKKFQEYREEVEADLRPGGELDHLVDWGNKLCGNVARIAGLLHTIHWVGASGYPWGTQISPETMGNAISLGNYFKEHAKAAFASMGADGRLVDAKRVWAAIVRHELKEFTVRDLWQKVRGSFSKVADLEEVLDLLLDLGYIAAMPVPKKEGPGQRPSPRYAVNPKALTQNPQDTPNTPDDSFEDV